jgi:hypothetical protein
MSETLKEKLLNRFAHQILLDKLNSGTEETVKASTWIWQKLTRQSLKLLSLHLQMINTFDLHRVTSSTMAHWETTSVDVSVMQLQEKLMITGKANVLAVVLNSQCASSNSLEVRKLIWIELHFL